MPVSLNRTLLLALLTASLVFCTACASIINRTHQTVEMSASVQGATVTLTEDGTGRVFGPWQTPAWVTLNKGQSYQVAFESPDGKTVSFAPPKSFDPISLINILGLLGFVADLFTGAIEKYSAEAYHADFEQNRVVPAIPGSKADWNTSGNSANNEGGNGGN